MIGNYFEECPFFNIVKVKDEIIENILTFPYTKYIMCGIDAGYYVSSIVNAKYIDAYCEREDYLHHLHIYGYDSDNQLIYLADHIKNGYFTFDQCTFSEIDKSKEKVNSDIAFIKLLKDVRYDLKADKIKYLIQEHLEGDNLFEKYKIGNLIYPNDSIDSCYFGQRYYDCLINIIDGGRFPYKRPIVLIHEHTKILKMLLFIIKRKYKYNIDELFDICEDLIKTAELLKYFYLKVQIINHFSEKDYNEIKDRKQVDKIIDMLCDIKKKENNFLEHALKILNEV